MYSEVINPKIEGAIQSSEFRPRSLVESLYKIISKALANELKRENMV